jgi:hypothetical protein
MAAGTIVVACAPVGSAPGPSSEAAPDAATTTITLLVPTQYGISRPETRTSNAEVILSLFEEYQTSVKPGTKIELEELVTPQGVLGWDVIRSRALAGNIPDAVAFQPVTTLMNADLFYQIPREVLNDPNPYSSNGTWWEDFPYDGAIFSSYPGATPNTDWAVGLTTIGGASVVGVVYNRQMFVDAGIHDSIDPGGDKAPKTWAEWMEWHQKLQEAGFIPFDASNHVAGSCCAVWFHSQIYDNLIEDHHADLEQQAAEFFGEQPDGMLNPRWGAYLIKTQKWNFGDEHQAAFFNILKEWSQYFQPGFLGQTTTNLFLNGEAAQGYVHVNNIKPWRTQLEDQFKWGTFYVPPITSDTWLGAPGLPQRAHAASGSPAGFAQGGFFMIPQQTVQANKLDVVLDLLQWITAPSQLERFNNTKEPRSAEPGATAAEVYGDDLEMQEYYRFYYEPTSIVDGKRYGADEWWHVVGPGAEALFHKTFQAWLAGQIATAEDAAADMGQIALDATERWIEENPDVTPPANTWA